VVAPIHLDPALKAGLVFMTYHFGDDVAVNVLTINVTDTRAGTAEFKACAVNVERIAAPVPPSAVAHEAQLVGGSAGE
jgi:formate dehydrogenase major subunit